MRAAFPADSGSVAALFAGMPGAQSLLLAALEGQGRVLTDASLRPRCAVATVGDFLFCGGEPGPSAGHLLRQAMGAYEDWLIVARGEWLQVLQSMTPVRMVTRMAFRHVIQPEDGHLRRLLTILPENATFQPIEGEWIARCRQAEWSRDFVSQYSDEQYAMLGLGVLLLVDGQAVAGASSYVSYPGGVEIQLQTRDDMQGRGYATLAAAKMILMAHERGLIATWDAANPASGRIAEKIGYVPKGLYQVAVIDKEKKHGMQDR